MNNRISPAHAAVVMGPLAVVYGYQNLTLTALLIGALGAAVTTVGLLTLLEKPNA